MARITVKDLLSVELENKYEELSGAIGHMAMQRRGNLRDAAKTMSSEVNDAISNLSNDQFQSKVGEWISDNYELSEEDGSAVDYGMRTLGSDLQELKEALEPLDSVVINREPVCTSAEALLENWRDGSGQPITTFSALVESAESFLNASADLDKFEEEYQTPWDEAIKEVDHLASESKIPEAILVIIDKMLPVIEGISDEHYHEFAELFWREIDRDEEIKFWKEWYSPARHPEETSLFWGYIADQMELLGVWSDAIHSPDGPAPGMNIFVQWCRYWIDEFDSTVVFLMEAGGDLPISTSDAEGRVFTESPKLERLHPTFYWYIEAGVVRSEARLSPFVERMILDVGPTLVPHQFISPILQIISESETSWFSEDSQTEVYSYNTDQRKLLDMLADAVAASYRESEKAWISPSRGAPSPQEISSLNGLDHDFMKLPFRRGTWTEIFSHYSLRDTASQFEVALLKKINDTDPDFDGFMAWMKSFEDRISEPFSPKHLRHLSQIGASDPVKFEHDLASAIIRTYFGVVGVSGNSVNDASESFGDIFHRLSVHGVAYDGYMPSLSDFLHREEKILEPQGRKFVKQLLEDAPKDRFYMSRFALRMMKMVLQLRGNKLEDDFEIKSNAT